MSMTRRKLLAYLGIGSAGIALAACQPKVVEKVVEKVVKETVVVEKEVEKIVKETVVVEKEVAAAAGEVVEIRCTHSWPAELWPRQEQFDDTFNEEHPNIKVVGENVVWGDYVPKLTAGAAAGTMPDLMYCQYAWAQNFIVGRTVISLQPYLNNDPEFWGEEDFNPESLKSYLFKGDLYFIPYDEGPTNMIYYNKRIFDEVGYPYPHSDKDWTYEDMLLAAKELTFGEGNERVWGWNGIPSMGGNLNMDYLATWGGRFWSDPCETESFVHEKEAVECLTWWAAFRLEHKVSPTPAEAETVPGNPFGFGRIAMMRGASWDNRWIHANLKDPYDIAHAYIGPNGKRSSSSMGSGYGITKDTPHREQCWEYLRNYLSTEGQIFVWAAPGVGSTTRWSAYPAYFASPLAPESAEVFMEALQDYAKHEILDSPNGYEITQTANPIWDLALLGELSVQEVCDQISEAVKPVMAKNAQWCEDAGLIE